MKAELKNYQEKAVEYLLRNTKNALENPGSQEIVFKAPTGSGKTVIMAGFLERFKEENIGDYAFVWISVNKLHSQSKKSLENNLGVGAFNFYNLEEIREKLNKNDILFFNWESVTKKAKKENLDKGIMAGDYTNIFMSENETSRNLPNFIDNTLDDGRQIILIIDESQLYLSPDTEKLIVNTIKPKLRIEVSATPKKNPTVSVGLEEVIEAGMIKKEVIINEGFGDINLLKSTGEEIVIEQGIKKREELKNLYENELKDEIGKFIEIIQNGEKKTIEIKKRINPLLLIQIPSENERDKTTKSFEKTQIEKVEKILKEKYDITRENKKLAVWLSEEKINLEDIEKDYSDVDVLIFKQAIATGWDCPRAQILLMFREIKSITFEIQTVGRIMRMPELKHYDNEIMNKAYVYTNFSKINIETGEASKYIKAKQSRFNPIYENIILPKSVYLKRLDYNDLSPANDFHKIFHSVFLKEIKGKDGDFTNVLYDKLNNIANLTKEFKIEILLETKLIGLDEIDKNYKTGETKVDEALIEGSFKKLLESYVSGYNKARSVGILKTSFYTFFDHYLGFESETRIKIQKIILTNIEFFAYIVKQSLKEFENVRIKNIEAKEKKKIYDFSIPSYEMYSDLYELKEDYLKCTMKPCYFKADSNLEKEFVEQYLEKSNSIEWWYKNGISKETYFGIFYNFDGKQRVFYPDFIVKFKDDKIGIFDTKDGNTASSLETRMKAEALQEYLKNKDNLFGGIVIKNKESFYLNSQKEYSLSESLSGWKVLN